MKKRKAIIIGCGIAGPATALFLKRIGLEPTIYEAKPVPDDDAGLFLTVASNGMSVLKTLNLHEQIIAEGFSTSQLIMQNGQGKRLGKVPIGTASSPSVASVTIRRGSLHKILRRAVVAHGIDIIFGKELDAIEISGRQKVTAHFTDGAAAMGGLLVGCDGIHSQTRKWVAPDAPPPVYTGLLSGGGFSHCSEVASTPDAMHMFFGKRAFFGYLAKPSGEVYWFENHQHPEPATRSELRDISQEVWQSKLLDLHRDDHRKIRKIICATEGAIGMYPIFDIPTLSRWQRGPIVILGDAAHATSPSAGQGASLALEDAITLATCLRDTEALTAALIAYEKMRRKRVERVVKYSRERGSNKALSNPVARWFRDLTLPFFLKHFANAESLAWLYDHKIDWSEKVELSQGETQ